LGLRVRVKVRIGLGLGLGSGLLTSASPLSSIVLGLGLR
jgi:hypothetical protein